MSKHFTFLAKECLTIQRKTRELAPEGMISIFYHLWNENKSPFTGTECKFNRESSSVLLMGTCLLSAVCLKPVWQQLTISGKLNVNIVAGAFLSACSLLLSAELDSYVSFLKTHARAHTQSMRVKISLRSSNCTHSTTEHLVFRSISWCSQRKGWACTESATKPTRPATCQSIYPYLTSGIKKENRSYMLHMAISMADKRGIIVSLHFRVKVLTCDAIE